MRSDLTPKTFAPIVATFAETSKIVAVMCANTAKTSAKVPRNRNSALTGAKLDQTLATFAATVEISEWTVAIGVVTFAIIGRTGDMRANLI
jgi:hypothetical protein